MLLIFQYVGLYPLSMANATVTREQAAFRTKLLITWSILIIVSVAFIAVAIITVTNSLNSLNDVAKLSTILFAHFIIVIETLWMRNELSSYFNKLMQVNVDLNELFDKSMSKRRIPSVDSYSRKFITYLLFASAIELIIIVRVQSDRQWCYYWYISIVPLMVGRLRHMQYAFLADILRVRLSLLRKEIQQLERIATPKIRTTKPADQAANEKCLLRNIRLVKNIYSNLYEMSVHLSSSCGVSQLINLMQNFIQVTSDLFWIYSVLYRNDSTHLTGTV